MITAPTQLHINNHDTHLAAPLIAMCPASPHLLSWTASSGGVGDLDYEIQIADQIDFGINPYSGQSSIVAQFEIPTVTETFWSQSPKFGTLFWRIRASDSTSSSDWSQIGSFVVNQPPGRVGGLSVRSQ